MAPIMWKGALRMLFSCMDAILKMYIILLIKCFKTLLNNDGFAQFDVVLIHTFGKFIGHKIGNQFTDG